MELERPLATVTSSLDGDVLAVLARSDSGFTTGQLHRLLPDFSEEGIRKVLGRLTLQGTVLSERVGNAYRYELNRDHLAAGPIIELASLKAALFVRLETLISEWTVTPTYAAVFGSTATGISAGASDLDLLLIRPGRGQREQWDRQVADLTDRVTRWTGNDVRPLEYSTAELVRAASEPVLQDVLAQGITLAGDRAWLSRQLRRRTA